MIRLLLLISLILPLAQCRKEESFKTPLPKPSYVLERTQDYTLAPPIPADDQWLESFRKGHGYGDGWETWIWRKTSINLGEGITVFARDKDETQFLIMGVPELDQICIDFKQQKIGEEWSFGSTHIGALTPSGNYVVVITQHTDNYLPSGMSLKERIKTDRGWDFQFRDDIASWWKR